LPFFLSPVTMTALLDRSLYVDLSETLSSGSKSEADHNPRGLVGAIGMARIWDLL
jgi:hypothetical protein